MSNYLFVYGSLKHGRELNSYLRGLSYMGQGKAIGYALFDLDGFPGLIPANVLPEHTAVGEIYMVQDEYLQELLRRLDRVERESIMYVRAKIRVTKDTGGIIECITYLFMPMFGGNIIQGGNW